MASIFDLKNDVSELPSVNQGLVNYRYRQINSMSDLTGDRFRTGGLQKFRWTVPRNEWFVPARSYFRFRGKITKGDGTQLSTVDGVAPNMGLMGCLYNSMRMKLNQNDISVMGEYCAQIEALENRMSKSKSWLDSMGVTINWWDPDFNKRLQDISSDGYDEGTYGTITYNYNDTAFLNFFSASNDLTVAYDHTGGAAERLITFAGTTVPDVQTILVAGDILTVTVGTTTYNFVVETVPTATTCTIAISARTTDFAAQAYDSVTLNKKSTYKPINARKTLGFEIIWQPALSIFKIDHALPLGEYELVLSPNSEYKRDAVECLVSKDPNVGSTQNDYNLDVVSMYFYACTMVSSNVSDGQYIIDLDETEMSTKLASSTSIENRFEISPSTYALTVAFQDNGVDGSEIYSSSKFKVRNNYDLELTELQVDYAGESKPIPRGDPEYGGFGGSDYLTQRYTDSMLYSGRYFDTGGPESYKDWLTRGPWYNFAWPKDGSDTSTTCTVRCRFSNARTERNMLLFWHKKKVAIVTIKNSEVMKVEVFDR